MSIWFSFIHLPYVKLKNFTKTKLLKINYLRQMYKLLSSLASGQALT